MSTTKRVLPLLALAAVAFGIVWFTSAGAAPVPAPKGPLNGELRVGDKYSFITGVDTDLGFYGKVLAVDGTWVRIDSYRMVLSGKEEPKYQEEKDDTIWLNLAQVTVVREKPPASVMPGRRPGTGRGGRGGPGGPGGAIPPGGGANAGGAGGLQDN